jgi:hypothetical protein
MKRVAVPILMLIGIGWYANTRAHVPAASIVNGVYSHPCCGSFSINNGIVVIGESRVPFDLENMKFGLTAFSKEQILVRNGQVKACSDADPGPLLFDESGMIVTVCGDKLCNQAYSFKRGRPRRAI